MTISRRHFLRQAAAVSAGFGGLRIFVLGGCTDMPPASEARADGFGPLVPDPAGVFDLPEGFNYRIISRFGDVMDDGLLVPHRPLSARWSSYAITR